MEPAELPAMVEIQENWQTRARQSQSYGTLAQTEPGIGSTNPVTPSSTNSRILPDGYQLSDIIQDLNQSLSLAPWSLASLVSTSIPDAQKPDLPSHPSWTQVTRCNANANANSDDDDDDETNGSANRDYAPNPRGQEGWVDDLVSESIAELERLLWESRRLCQLRLDQEQHLRRQQKEVLLRPQRPRQAKCLGDVQPEERWSQEEHKGRLHEEWRLQEERRLRLQKEERHRLQALGEVNRPWTCRCAGMDENGKETEGEWDCVCLPNREFVGEEDSATRMQRVQERRTARPEMPIYQRQLPAQGNRTMPIVDMAPPMVKLPRQQRRRRRRRRRSQPP